MLLALGFGFVLHIFLDYDYFINRIIYIDDLTWSDKFYAVAAVGIVLEATPIDAKRRTVPAATPAEMMMIGSTVRPRPGARSARDSAAGPRSR